MHRDTKEPKTAGHCKPAVRNRYFRGKCLTVHDYEAEQRYLIGRRRLVNRAVLGWGIVSGFDVDREMQQLTVAPGVALDCQGRELVLCETFRICEVDDVIWLKPGKCGLGASDEPLPDGRYLLSAHYAECRINGVRIDDGCGKVVCEPNHICETVVFSLRADTGGPPFGVCECTELDPDPDPNRRQDPAPAEIPRQLPYVAPKGDRGVGNLCRELPCPADKTRREGAASDRYRDSACGCRFDPCCPPQLSPLGCCKIDFDAGVPLLYATVSRADCRLNFTEHTDIIGCCDLTAIKDIGWRNWHQLPAVEIGRAPFFAMFVPPRAGLPVSSDPEEDDDSDNRPFRDQPVYPPVDTHFWVCFTGPVQITSLTPDVMTMSLAQADSREAVWNVVLVPIIRLWCAPTTLGDPPGTTRAFRPMVQHEFWSGEINRGVSSGFRLRTLVEIRIHASAIIDWKGQALDGYSIGQHLPTGNGSPGGDFVSSWRVRRGGPAIPPRGAIPLAPLP